MPREHEAQQIVPAARQRRVPFPAACVRVTAELKAWLAARLEQQPVACAVALAVLAVAAAAVVDAALHDVRTRDIDSVVALQAYYRQLGYVEPAVSSGEVAVPRVYLSRIPEGWADDQPVAVKKSLFFRTLLPLVLKVNEDIARERRRLKRLAAAARATGAPGDRDDRAWLRRLAVRYEVVGATAEPPADRLIAALLRRVDTIPPSLALAQAAVESGYGSSRFAVDGNALYGQWRTGGGLRPRAQPEHLSGYGVAAFSSPLRSVAAYARNLNTFAAYRGFRARRAEQGAGARDALALADTLSAYSASGAKYVATVKRIIRDNQLARFDDVRLGGGPPVILRPVARDVTPAAGLARAGPAPAARRIR